MVTIVFPYVKMAEKGGGVFIYLKASTVSYFQYLQNTIQQMTEAWEDILLEMDSKLYNFAEQKQVSFTSQVGSEISKGTVFCH